MKKGRRIYLVYSVTILLVSLIAVTVAWYRVFNDGQIQVNIDTQVQDGIVFSFSPFSELEGSLYPAVMKEGVVNNTLVLEEYKSGTSLNELNIPHGNSILPKVEPVYDSLGNILYYKYVVDNDNYGNLLPQDSTEAESLLESPATVLYRGITLKMGSQTGDAKIAKFSISFQYSDIHGKFESEDESGEKTPYDLKQSDAMMIRFYLLDGDLGEDNFSALSTQRLYSYSESKYGKIKTFRTFSDIMYQQAIKPDGTAGKIKIFDGYQTDPRTFTVDGDPEDFNCDKVNTATEATTGYEIVPYVNKLSNDNFTLEFTIANLNINIQYYLVIVMAYYLPDELLDGNLWLTKAMLMNISYSMDSYTTILNS